LPPQVLIVITHYMVVEVRFSPHILHLFACAVNTCNSVRLQTRIAKFANIEYDNANIAYDNANIEYDNANIEYGNE